MTRSTTRRQFLLTSAVAGLWTVGGCGGPKSVPEPSPPPADAMPSGSEDAAAAAPPDPDDPQGWGDLRGRLVYDGPTPEREKLIVDTDVECCGEFDIRDESLMVGADGGLANVFIYRCRKPRAIHPALEEAAPAEVVLDNLDCIFQPHCMTIWVDKQIYRIINSDPVAQNVAFSPPFDRKANIVLGVGKEATWEFGYPQTEPVPIACNYHPWESAFILPLDHPYVAITQEDGTFTIPRLAVGRHEFQLWHERPKRLETASWPAGRVTVDIVPGENDLGTIRLAPELFER